MSEWDEDKMIFRVKYLDTLTGKTNTFCVAAEYLDEAYRIADDYLNKGNIEGGDFYIKSIKFVDYFIEPIKGLGGEP